MVVVYEEIVFEFEEWAEEIVEKLQSRDIVTIDLEEFQKDLTVCDSLNHLSNVYANVSECILY